MDRRPTRERSPDDHPTGDPVRDSQTDDSTRDRPTGDPSPAPSTGDPRVDHGAIPDSFVATIRVERTAPDSYRATQYDTDLEGYGSTPHLAIVEFVRRAEASCFGPRIPDDRKKGGRPAGGE